MVSLEPAGPGPLSGDADPDAAAADGPVEARVFTFLSAGNLSATTYFGIPPERVVELGAQVEI